MCKANDFLRFLARNGTSISITAAHYKVNSFGYIYDVGFTLISRQNEEKCLGKIRKRGNWRKICEKHGKCVKKHGKSEKNAPKVEKLTISAKIPTAQNEKRVSTSPHLSPKKLPSGCCKPLTYFATAFTSISFKRS